MPLFARFGALAFIFSSLSFAQTTTTQTTTAFDALRWRFIGPFRGGRVITVAGIPGDDRTFYFGSVGGGAFKTTDGGTVWTPIFDGQPIASIGAIAVAPSDPNVVYIGSGEADMRSDISVGNGIYKSTDAGKTWKNIGLKDSQQIGRIAIDPKNADIVYVAALGHAYAPNPERGVFRSTNGGQTWQKVLDKGPSIGAIDMALDPANARTIYATMWNSHRPPWSQYGPIEGPGSGLFKSTDGGDTWTQITGNGLPSGDWRRAGIAVGSGERVYALIDAKTGGGLYRSDDAGKTWIHPGTDTRVVSRDWYFGQLAVDPQNPDIVYVPNVAVYRSTDGGKTFDVLKGQPGGDDYHALWIDPTTPSRMILGSDQGVNISFDTGRTWTPWYNQPTAQIYHVVTDNQFPYWVYGCQQDSGTVALPSRTDHGRIYENDRRNVGSAESGYIAPDPKDSNIFYVDDTAGNLVRYDRRSSQSQNIVPWPESGFGMDISQRKYRYTWTSPLIFSPLDPNALFYGSQYLLKTTDGGLTWAEISPDLTGSESKGKSAPADGPPTNENTKARGYGVVYSIAPSPLNASLIWTGSDTGLIQLTRDGGKNWSNVTPKGLSDWSKIAQLDASHFDPAVVYAAVDRHRLDDYTPHIFRTRDYGKTWTEIDSGISARAFVNAVREDPVRKGVLYAATEMGVYVSFDDGGHWQSLQLNLPVTSVRDLVVHGADLVIATHGRGFWIFDDIEPLREAMPAGAPRLYKPVIATRILNDGFQGTPFPPEWPHGENPPDGAVVDYYLPAAASGEVTLEILDAQNQVVRRYSSNDRESATPAHGAVADLWLVPPPRVTTHAGVNRFAWDLHYAAPESMGGRRRGGEEEGEGGGPLAIPGTYQVRLTVMGQTLTQPLKVRLDPRSAATPAELSAQFDLAIKATQQMKRSAELASKNPAAHSKLVAINGKFATVLNITNTADRKPPAIAYTFYNQALRDLDAIEHSGPEMRQ